MALLKCAECKSYVSSKADVCPHCGCPFSEITCKNKKNIKKCICISTVFLLLLIAGATVVWKLSSIQAQNGYYNNISWGSSSQKIMEKLSDAEKRGDKNINILSSENDFCGLTGLTALSMYDLPDDSLTKVTLFISNNSNTSYTASKIIETIASDYDAKYGSHTTDAVSLVWETPKSEIAIIKFSEKLILVSFTDINLIHEDNKGSI